MKKRNKISFLSVLFVLLGFAELAQAHYSPQLGRFLSRDPIGERGGVNVHAFVRNDPSNSIDYLGLKIKLNPIQEGTYAEGLENESATLGEGWIGSTRGTKKSASVRKGKNKVVIYGEGGCCVKIEDSKYYEVEVSTFIANDLLGDKYTEQGYTAIKAHEQRRRDVYSIGHDTYLKVFDKDIKSKCGKCLRNKLKAKAYKRKLEKWLSDQHSNASRGYDKFAKTNQTAITKENKSSNIIRFGDKNLIHGLKKIHEIENPNFDLDPCPK